MDAWQFREHAWDTEYEKFDYSPEFDNLSFAKVITSKAVRDHICNELQKYVHHVKLEDIRLTFLEF